MKTLIIYESVHHGNTEKIAKTIAESLNAVMMKISEVNKDIINDYDLIGFGSGIYYGKLHKNIVEFVDGLSTIDNKKAFVFSTSGQGKVKYNDLIEKKLKRHGFQVLDSFACKGYDTFGPFKLIGGLSKGRPNSEDFKKAKDFSEKLKKYK